MSQDMGNKLWLNYTESDDTLRFSKLVGNQLSILELHKEGLTACTLHVVQWGLRFIIHAEL